MIIFDILGTGTDVFIIGNICLKLVAQYKMFDQIVWLESKWPQGRYFLIF